LDIEVTTDASSSLYDDMATEILEQDNAGVINDEGPVDDEEEDFGYVREDSEGEDSEAEGMEVGQDEQDDVSDQDLGPEGDAQGFDILEEFGYADL
jgi:hypothetical protein